MFVLDKVFCYPGRDLAQDMGKEQNTEIGKLMIHGKVTVEIRM